MAKRPVSAAGRIGLALAALLGPIVAAVLGGSMIPANAGWEAPARGVRIYVTTNGVHTGIILPAAPWRDFIRPEHLRNPTPGDWLLFGWGEHDFYLNTPEWKDVSVPRVARAMIGSDRTLMHVQHLARVTLDGETRPLMLSPAQYAALTRAIRADFTEHGETLAGYGQSDAFYTGRGHYSAVETCNEWTGGKLRGIGVKVGIWTPTSWSVMRWF